MEIVDVLVVGAELAGLHTATLLAWRGHDVLLVDRRPRLTGTIRTTGVFVRRTLDDFSPRSECLGPPIRRAVHGHARSARFAAWSDARTTSGKVGRSAALG
jgi:flavin-dependent dehydrogenase